MAKGMIAYTAKSGPWCSIGASGKIVTKENEGRSDRDPRILLHISYASLTKDGQPNTGVEPWRSSAN